MLVFVFRVALGRRQAIPTGPGGTALASRAQIENAARRIYADYPEILKALGL
jgi:hypothetical protein